MTSFNVSKYKHIFFIALCLLCCQLLLMTYSKYFKQYSLIPPRMLRSHWLAERADVTTPAVTIYSQRSDVIHRAKVESENDVISDPQHDVIDDPKDDVTNEPENGVINDPPEHDVTNDPKNDVINKPPEHDVTNEPENHVINKPPEHDAVNEAEKNVIAEPDNDVKNKPGQGGLESDTAKELFQLEAFNVIIHPSPPPKHDVTIPPSRHHAATHPPPPPPPPTAPRPRLIPDTINPPPGEYVIRPPMGPIIHPPASFLINVEKACLEPNPVDIFMPVHSAMTNFERRRTTRRRREVSVILNGKKKVRTLFFVGLPSRRLPNASFYQSELQKESREYGDIVQINMTEAYRNLGFKAMAVLQWTSTYCRDSKFVLKTDDDVNLHTRKLFSLLSDMRESYEHFVVGKGKSKEKPKRDVNSQWYVSRQEFPHKFYPAFAYGPAIGYPTRTAVLLHQQAVRTRILWLDDVFVTGICRQALGIPLLTNGYFRHVHKQTKFNETGLFVLEE